LLVVASWLLLVASHYGDLYPEPPALGSLLAFTTVTSNGPEIHVMLADGKRRAHVRSGLQPTWSPDGRRIAYTTVDEATSDIVVMNVDGSNARRLTDDAHADVQPSWSPDGNRIAFVSTRDGNSDIYVAGVSEGSVRRVTTHGGADIEPAWSPSGALIAFSSTRDGGANIYVMRPDGGGLVRLTTSGLDHSPAWSSRGSAIAFASAREGPTEIFLMSSDGSTERRVSDVDGADDPSWSPDDKRITFSSRLEIYVLDLVSRRTVKLTSDTQDTDPAWQPRASSALDNEPGVGVGSAGGSASVEGQPLSAGRVDGQRSATADALAGPAGTARRGSSAQGSEDLRPSPGESRRTNDHERPSIASSLAKPSEIPFDAKAVATSALGASLLLLLAFPANLFSNTFEEHYDEIVDWFGRRRKRGRDPSTARRWMWLGAMGLVTAGLSGFLDPAFGFDRASLVTVLSVVALFAILTLIRGAQILYVRRTGDSARIVAFPGALLISALTVGASRIVAFQPGYLYGNLTGASADDMSIQRKGRMQAVGLAVTLAVSFCAWGLWSLVADAAAGGSPSLIVVVVDAVLAACFVGGVGSVLFALLPMRWVEGYDIMRASRWMWIALTVPTTFAFVHFLLKPSKGTGDSLVLPAIMFFAFGAISVGFWAYFRFRRPVDPTIVPSRELQLDAVP
jgi:TolB protein